MGWGAKSKDGDKQGTDDCVGACVRRGQQTKRSNETRKKKKKKKEKKVKGLNKQRHLFVAIISVQNKHSILGERTEFRKCGHRRGRGANKST
jgi:hypothetical protein